MTKRCRLDLPRRLRRALPLLCSLLLFCGIAGCRDEKPQGGILEVSGPTGLVTEIGGRSFRKNPQRLRLAPKSYIVKCSAPGFRDRYYPIKVKNNDRISIRAELEVLRSAVLIESTPAGAQVFYRGAPRGVTPAVLPDLPPGEHRAVLKLAGYADREITWVLRDERPMRVQSELELNTGVLIFESTPAGAKVLIDGVEAGTTPLRAERAEGRYQVRFESPGCVPAERTVTLKRGTEEKVSASLKMKPVRLTVESVPEGAEIFLNGEKRGVAPCVIENLVAGTYQIRAALARHEAAEREIALVAGSSETIRFVLVSGVGSCRIVVRPAGVALTLDGKPIGVVKPAPGDRKEVLPIVLHDLNPGPHTLGMSHPRAEPKRVKKHPFVIQKGKETSVEESMWIPDCEIVTLNGDAMRGILVSENSDKIFFGMGPGITSEVERSTLRSIRWLPTHEAIRTDGKVVRGIVTLDSDVMIVMESEPGRPIEIPRSSLRSLRRLPDREE